MPFFKINNRLNLPRFIFVTHKLNYSIQYHIIVINPLQYFVNFRLLFVFRYSIGILTISCSCLPAAAAAAAGYLFDYMSFPKYNIQVTAK